MPSDDQGVDAQHYHVIPRTLIFVFDSKDRVLLIKGAPEKRLWAGLLNGIGGHIEAGEDILEAAKRELYEETGIKGIPLRFCGQIMVDVAAKVGVSIFIFKGTYANELLISSAEGELVWVSLNALDQAPVVEDLPILTPKIAFHQSSDPLIIGKYRYQQDGSLEMSFN